MERQTICLPGLHDLNVAPIRPIVDSPLFQRLRGLKQLGPSSTIFPHADQSRFVHSLCTYSITEERTRRWVEDGIITKDDALQLALHGLLHDNGHSVYSHASEALCPHDHNTQGVLNLQKLQREIEACGGNVETIGALMSHQHPMHVCVSDRPIGTDKLAYLFLDARNTTEAIAFRMGDLLNYVSYSDGKLLIDIDIVPEVLQLHSAYVYMYTRVYCRKAALIVQAFLQQIVHLAIKSGHLRNGQLSVLTDCEIDSILVHVECAVVRELFQRYRERKQPKTVLEIRPTGAGLLSKKNGHKMTTFHVPLKDFNRFTPLRTPFIARDVESKIADLVGLSPHQVLIVPDVPLTRLIPYDATIVHKNEIVGTLNEARPIHYQALEEEMAASIALRVCVPQEMRERIAHPSIGEEIFKFLMSL